MGEGRLSSDQVKAYEKDGYVLYPALFDAEEIALLSRSAKTDHELDRHVLSRDDGTGLRVRLSLWNHPGEGIYGMFARCRKLVDSVEQLLGEEVRKGVGAQ